MGRDGAHDDDDALTRAERTLEEQAAELDDLRRRLAGERFAEQLREALTVAQAASEIGSPVTHERLLEMIVETAAHVISARSAALFLLDDATDELVFQVALGSKAEAVRSFRVPLGHGVAGLVALTGQPMAIADARGDPRIATDIAESVGYIPDSVLCVPLFYGDRVIGALELLDKAGASSFAPSDIDALALFANQAAVALQQSRTRANVGALIVEMLQGVPDDEGRTLAPQAESFAGAAQADPNYARALELARLVHDVSRRGEREWEACRAILTAFSAYLRSEPRLGAGVQ
jgi:GAF domain-containing protein